MKRHRHMNHKKQTTRRRRRHGGNGETRDEIWSGGGTIMLPIHHTIAACFENMVAIREEDNQVTCFAEDDSIQTICDSKRPHEVTHPTAVACGLDHFAALQDGQVYCWGSNRAGQCTIPQVHDIEWIACLKRTTMAGHSGGQLMAWGDDSGEIMATFSAASTGIQQMFTGNNHCTAIMMDGSVLCAGDNTYHQCDVPAGLVDVIQLACGDRYTVALLRSGSVQVWGDFPYTIDPEAPLVSAIACSGMELALITQDNKVYTTNAIGDVFELDVTQYGPPIDMVANYDFLYVLHESGHIQCMTLGTANTCLALNDFVAKRPDRVILM